MTILEALENALMMLESQGLYHGDVHDDLSLAINRLRIKYPHIAKEQL